MQAVTVFLGLCVLSISGTTHRIVVESGKGFTVFFRRPKTPDFGKVVECHLHHSRNPDEFRSFNLNELPDGRYNNKTENFEIIQSYSGDECGAQVRNVSMESEGLWELTAVDENSMENSEDIIVEIKNPQEYRDFEMECSVPGDLVNLACSMEIYRVEQRTEVLQVTQLDDEAEPQEVTTIKDLEPEYFFYNCEIEDVDSGKTYQGC